MVGTFCSLKCSSNAEFDIDARVLSKGLKTMANKTQEELINIRRELERAQRNQEPQPSAELAAKYAKQIIESQFNNREAPKR